MARPSDLMDRVALLLVEVSKAVIEPRMASIADLDVREKSPGELVTVADEEAEVLLTARLSELIPDAPIVGEEACGVNPALLGALDAQRAWLVDPVDGTANFATGSADWAVMVALVENGRTCCSWIYQPVHERMYMAEAGAGSTCNGRPLECAAHATTTDGLLGRIHSRFLDDSQREHVRLNRERYGSILEGRGAAGIEYPALAEQQTDFILWWRTLPWDHAPGALIAEEAGGVVRRLDGTRYQPSQATTGLLVAADEATWKLARPIVGA